MSSALTPALCRAARAMLGWTQQELAAKSGVSARHVVRFENGRDDQYPKLREQLYRAFADTDIQFIAANTDTTELDGLGLRWKPKRQHSGIKIV
ncbi:helix-turn-helix domain-containing protein [Rhizobium sp. R693]|uniref:helix-turn-helix domain-containing protein n=1 Tax=Rhizobium sp. R693 TaxID=1764276 RepID=UPI000B5354E2|nr:helix-turn-helix domain-containing protein [Rhizobium sp. R693]OWV90371.1 hypothetical protein ATY79_28420 [Rhizobium sp. R693]